MSKTIHLLLLAIIAVLGSYTLGLAHEEDCSINVNCDTTIGQTAINSNHWVRANLQRAVVRIFDRSQTGPTQCMGGSGVLINTALCGETEPRPLVLTSYHVIETAVDNNTLDSLVFVFGYLPDSCGAVDSSFWPCPDTTAKTIVGASLAAGNPYGLAYEFALLELNGDPLDSANFDPYYVGWTRDAEPSEPYVNLSHPKGLPMRLFAETDTAPSYQQVESQDPDAFLELDIGDHEYGVLHVGSSGSGLFELDDSGAKVIGCMSDVTAEYTSYLCVRDTSYASFWRVGFVWDHCCAGMTGDANDSGDDEPTIGDISVIIDSLFINYAAIPCPAEADVNGSGSISYADISYLVDYLNYSGQAPCDCDDVISYFDWPTIDEYLDPDDLDLQSLDGWDPDDDYPNWTGCPE